MLLVFAGPASAFVNGSWFQERSTVDQHATTDFLYEQSPQGTVPYGGEAAEISAEISHTYESETSVESFYSDLAASTTDVGESVGLLPSIETAASAIPEAGGAFLLGVLIGEGVNAIFADIGLGVGAVPEGGREERYEWCLTGPCGGTLEYYPYGAKLYGAATVQESPGAYLYRGTLYHNGSPNGGVLAMWDEPPCDWGEFGSSFPGAGLEVEAAGVGCGGGHEDVIVYPYVSVPDVLGHEEIHPYDALIDGKPAIKLKAPKDPGTTVVEERAAESLDQSELLQDFFTENEEPEPSHEYLPAPTATEMSVDDEERRCDRGSGPIFSNLDGNKDPSPFEVKEPTAFTVTSLPEGVESTSPVYLRWGETSWLGEKQEKPQLMDLWGGWGYRKIQAKHGWDALDRTETESALSRTQTPIPTGAGKYRYTAPDEAGGKEGAKCERVVIVQFTKGEDKETHEEDPAPRGIVSSFNEVVP